MVSKYSEKILHCEPLNQWLCLGYVKTYIIMSGAVWGIPIGTVADTGVQHMHSVQLPRMVQASIKRGQTGFVGGKNVWPHIEVNESEYVIVNSLFVWLHS